MGTLINMTTNTQLSIIRKYLLRYGKIDKPTAMRICGCDRLGARIYDLRNDPVNPMNIVTETHYKKNMFGRKTGFAVYRLVA